MGLPPCPSDSGAMGDTGTSLALQAGPVVFVGPSHIMAIVPQAGSEGERPAAPLPSKFSGLSCGLPQRAGSGPVSADHLLPEWEACAAESCHGRGAGAAGLLLLRSVGGKTSNSN